MDLDRYCTARVYFPDDPDLPKPTPSQQSFRVLIRYSFSSSSSSSCCIWNNPPAICTPANIRQFLEQEGIFQKELICELFLDSFSCYKELGLCEEQGVLLDFTKVTPHQPGLLTVRFTDASMITATPVSSKSIFPLFAFFVAVWLESFHFLQIEIGDMNLPPLFFQGGRVALVVGGFFLWRFGWKESKRSNLYRASVLIALGCFCFWNSVVTKQTIVGECKSLLGRTANSNSFSGYIPIQRRSRVTWKWFHGGIQVTSNTPTEDVSSVSRTCGSVHELDASLNFLLSFWQTMCVAVLFKRKLVLSKASTLLVICVLMHSVWRASHYDPVLVIRVLEKAQLILGIFVSSYCLWCFQE
jgi:hypothetical protein